jgi:hypothetical protein
MAARPLPELRGIRAGGRCGLAPVDVDQADGCPAVCQQGPGGQNPSSELVRDKGGESPLLVVRIDEDRVGACQLWRQFHLLVRDGRVDDAMGPALSEPGHRLADQTAVVAGFHDHEQVPVVPGSVLGAPDHLACERPLRDPAGDEPEGRVCPAAQLPSRLIADVADLLNGGSHPLRRSGCSASRTGHLARFFQRGWRPLPRRGVPGLRRKPSPRCQQAALRGAEAGRPPRRRFAVAALAGQHVRCKMALVSLAVLVSTPIACAVGKMTRSTSQRRACSRTSFITGSAPSAPVPITSRRHRHGISSEADSGVWA